MCLLGSQSTRISFDESKFKLWVSISYIKPKKVFCIKQLIFFSVFLHYVCLLDLLICDIIGWHFTDVDDTRTAKSQFLFCTWKDEPVSDSHGRVHGFKSQLIYEERPSLIIKIICNVLGSSQFMRVAGKQEQCWEFLSVRIINVCLVKWARVTWNFHFFFLMWQSQRGYGGCAFINWLNLRSEL